MGGAVSVPTPPPRLAKRERISLIGTPEPILSTLRTMDLPPAITPTALAGIHLAAGLRRHHIFPTARAISDSDIETTNSMLSSLIADAMKACNIRDYVTLLIEKTIIRLSMDLGPPTEDLLAVARFLNPFLVEEGSSSERLEPFRETDGALVTGPEKNLLVLLYYCHEGNIKGSADEAVKHMSSVAGKYGVIKELDTRKEPFTETEVYIFWCLTFLATNISTSTSTPTLRTKTRALLTTELSTQLTRLLTTTEILLSESRHDQACFLLTFLPRLVAREDRGWWKGRAKKIGRELGRNSVVRQGWHVGFAEKTIKELMKGDGGLEGWARRNSFGFSREELGSGADPLKGL